MLVLTYYNFLSIFVILLTKLSVLETAMVSYIFPSFKFVAVRSSKLELTRLVKLPV